MQNPARVDYTLYLVTDRGILGGRNLFEAVEAAIRGGVTLLQLREKDASGREFYELALQMKRVAASHHIPLIINDRLDIALAVDADGLHVGQDDLPVDVARRLLGPGKILGCSVSNEEEAVQAERAGADYLGAGIVYPTGSKEVTAPPIGVDGLRRIKEAVSIPVVGIGGIGLHNIAAVKEAGVDGISVISAILGSRDIEEAARGLVKAWRQV
ncbi:MAG TPA: thiamine phosphate synthase [Syntrophomonadaceae bacterium]|nr:thiamine phosphate synthase [Syntrophomonadaceae bacterium]